MEEADTKKKAPISTVILALVLAALLKLFIFDFMIAEGNSMAPAIVPGKILIINKLAYGFRLPFSGNYLVKWKHPAEGDIVVFYTPEGEIAVKRCVKLIENNFYAEGDNGFQSYDSRSYGPVNVDNIIGRVLGVK